ncbi:MAG: DUF1573 domain-containing protein [Bacteroidota bacterium]|nr:DUF1573 domain-containing protein [Bacteroidota bacterium]
MKFFFSSPCIYLLVLLFTGFNYAQPKIQLDKTKIELGTIYQGEIKIIQLIVSNTGTTPLVITRVQPSCGCTSVKNIVQPIAPSASDTIKVSFNSLGFEGTIHKSVSIQSNDSVKPYIEAMFTGSVASELETVPKMQIINFGTPWGSADSSTSLLFKNTSNESLTLLEVSCADSTVRAQIGHGRAKQVKPQDTVRVSFTITPRSPWSVNNTFYVITTSPRQPRVPFRFMYGGR